MFELKLQRAVLKERYERDSGNAVVIKALNTHLQGMPPPELEQMLSEKFHSEAGRR
jgi:hypothetical protein